MNSRHQVELNDGHFIPVLGFGTCVTEEFFKKKSMDSTKLAIDAGFCHIDCFHLYQNEEEIGQAIRSKIEDGTVKREDIFYTSKLWSTFRRPELVRASLENSLKKLGLDYVDLYLIHFPVSLKAMEKCKDAGLAKSIGVSNFNRRQLEMILNKPGLKYKPVCNQVDETTPVLLDDPVLCTTAKKYKRTPALIALRYQLQCGVVVLAKSFNEEIKENTQVFDFQLTSEDMKILDSLDRNCQFFTALMFSEHPNFPFSDDY
uniref:Aldo-keto reductase family 1, member C18 n=1 Tax=Nannospalax galili TaxID=1026970 RepID=A0A8C6RAR9_NANGA